MNTIKKGIAVMVFLLIIPTILFLQSCSNENDSNIVSENNQELLKTQFKSTAKNIFTNKKNLKNTNVNNLTPAEKTQLAQTSLELIKSYGLTEAEIETDLEGITEDKFIESSLSLIAIEEEAQENNLELINIDDNTSLLTGQLVPSLSLNKSHQAKSQVVHCALEAIGINAIGELITNGIKNMPKSAVKKVLKKVASKYLGYIGAAIAIYEFGDCMEWW